MKYRRLMLMLVIAALATAPALAGEKKHKDCDLSEAEYQKQVAHKLATKPWLGIEMEHNEDGTFDITKVIPGSPAEAAGFQAGDTLIAINGEKYSKDNMKAVKKAWSELEPGSEAIYVVVRKGGKLKLKATLSNLPEEYQKKYLQEHMKKYHAKG